MDKDVESYLRTGFVRAVDTKGHRPLGDSKIQLTGPQREQRDARIERYKIRAEQGLPLFEGDEDEPEDEDPVEKEWRSWIEFGKRPKMG